MQINMQCQTSHTSIKQGNGLHEELLGGNLIGVKNTDELIAWNSGARRVQVRAAVVDVSRFSIHFTYISKSW